MAAAPKYTEIPFDYGTDRIHMAHSKQRKLRPYRCSPLKPDIIENESHLLCGRPNL